MSKMVYVKTDKNGTKIYHDYTCHHCGGAGGCDQWAYTGWTCYYCGGTGRSEKASIIKEYTPEYEAKLLKQREAREAKRLAEQIEKFNNERQQMIEDMGFGSDNKIYVTIGNTFEIKEQLKLEGARWLFGHWILPHATDLAQYVTLTSDECLDFIPESGIINWKSGMLDMINDKIKALEPVDDRESNFVGTVGEKLEIEATFVKRASYDTTFAYREVTHYIYSFVDDDGNVIIWNTTSWNEDLFKANKNDEHPRVLITGKVKEHKVYRDTKQTSLERCKISLK